MKWAMASIAGDANLQGILSNRIQQKRGIATSLKQRKVIALSLTQSKQWKKYVEPLKKGTQC